jgi:hypothetical protein
MAVSTVLHTTSRQNSADSVEAFKQEIDDIFDAYGCYISIPHDETIREVSLKIIASCAKDFFETRQKLDAAQELAAYRLNELEEVTKEKLFYLQKCEELYNGFKEESFMADCVSVMQLNSAADNPIQWLSADQIENVRAAMASTIRFYLDAIFS